MHVYASRHWNNIMIIGFFSLIFILRNFIRTADAGHGETRDTSEKYASYRWELFQIIRKKYYYIFWNICIYFQCITCNRLQITNVCHKCCCSKFNCSWTARSFDECGMEARFFPSPILGLRSSAHPSRTSCSPVYEILLTSFSTPFSPHLVLTSSQALRFHPKIYLFLKRWWHLCNIADFFMFVFFFFYLSDLFLWFIE